MHGNRIITLSDKFVTSCGTISVDPVHRKVLILHHRAKNKFILPKGRKNRGERLEDAAVRETLEETGYSCNLLPHSGATKAPLPDRNPLSNPTTRSAQSATEGEQGTVLHTESLAVQQWVYAEDDVSLFSGFWQRGIRRRCLLKIWRTMERIMMHNGLVSRGYLRH